MLLAPESATQVGFLISLLLDMAEEEANAGRNEDERAQVIGEAQKGTADEKTRPFENNK